MHKNLLKKYGLTEEKLKEGIATVCKSGLSKICDVTVMIAVADLLSKGDIGGEINE